MIMMRVRVDQDACVASGQCVMTVAEIFDQREEDGIVTLLRDDVPEELAEDVRQAVALCPAQAISVDE